MSQNQNQLTHWGIRIEEIYATYIDEKVIPTNLCLMYNHAR